MKWIKYILGVLFLGMAVASIPDILINIVPAINGWDNALSHIIFGIYLVILFGFIALKFIKSAQEEDK